MLVPPAKVHVERALLASVQLDSVALPSSSGVSVNDRLPVACVS